jgi:hypothetical protein
LKHEIMNRNETSGGINEVKWSVKCNWSGFWGQLSVCLLLGVGIVEGGQSKFDGWGKSFELRFRGDLRRLSLNLEWLKLEGKKRVERHSGRAYSSSIRKNKTTRKLRNPTKQTKERIRKQLGINQKAIRKLS